MLAGPSTWWSSNPPYVAEADFPDLDPTVRLWEPRVALVAPGRATVSGGMADIEAIIADAARWLRPSGVMVVEIDPAQAEAALDACPTGRMRAGAGRERDLAGRIRMVVARR